MKTNFRDMKKELGDRIEYLTSICMESNNQQDADFDHMEHQARILHDEHDRMNELGEINEGKTSTL